MVIAVMIATNGCALIKVPMPFKEDVPAAFNFPKPPVASPVAFFIPEIAELRFGNSPIICCNASLKPKLAPKIVDIPPNSSTADLEFKLR